MLDSSIAYKKAFKHLSDVDANYTDCPTNTEWDKMLAMRDFLSIFNLGVYAFFFFLIQYTETLFFCPSNHFTARNDKPPHFSSDLQNNKDDQ
jgi:hypothetical protein